MVEHEAHAAAGAESSSTLGEVTADIGDGAGVVVRGSLHKVGYSVRTISLIDDLLEISLILLKGFLYCPLDVVLGHVLAPGLSHESPKPRVAGHIRTTLLDSDGYLLPNLREGLGHMAPSLEFSLLAELKRSSHDYFWLSILEMYLSMS